MGIIKDYNEHIFEIECDLCKERFTTKKGFKRLKYREWQPVYTIPPHYWLTKLFGEIYVCEKCFKNIKKNLKKLAEVKE